MYKRVEIYLTPDQGHMLRKVNSLCLDAYYYAIVGLIATYGYDVSKLHGTQFYDNVLVITLLERVREKAI